MPPRFRIDIPGKGVGIGLEIEYTEEYPRVLPEIIITCTSGRLSNISTLRDGVLSEGRASMGMVMVFTLVTYIEEWLHENVKAPSSDLLLKKVEEKTVDTFVTMKGGPVTVESFKEWNGKFMAEMSAAKGNLKSTNESKLTGRQLFERNKSLATSDVVFIGDADDDVLFEGLEDLQVDDEDNLDESIE